MARYAKSLGFTQRETAPATPATGNIEMYLMDDGKLYKKDDAGTESEVGGGGSSASEGTAISGSSGALTVTMDGTYKFLDVTGDCNLTPSLGADGLECKIIIASSSPGLIVTFNQQFCTTGTITTVAYAAIIISFISLYNTWLETSRTAAIPW